MAALQYDAAPPHMAPPHTEPAHTAPAHSVPHTAPKSDMQRDMDGWVEKFNHAAKDHRQVTHAPGDAPWSNGFWACCTPADTCFITCCCPCVTFGKTHHRLTHGDLESWSPVNFSCIAWYASAFIGLNWVGNLLQRNDIRQRGNPKLGGEIVTDCLKAFCCGCCDLIQQDKEAEALLARERTVTHQPDLKADGMNYAPPH